MDMSPQHVCVSVRQDKAVCERRKERSGHCTWANKRENGGTERRAGNKVDDTLNVRNHQKEKTERALERLTNSWSDEAIECHKAGKKGEVTTRRGKTRQKGAKA